MKKFIKVIVGILVLLSFVMSLCSLASDEIQVSIDGEYVEFDVAPKILNDRTMVPFRAIFEALGAEVDWDSATKTVIATKDSVVVTATIGNREMYINGEEKMMDVAPVIIDNRTLVPVRFVAEAFDCDVDWDGDNNAVYIYSVVDSEEPLLPDNIINEQEE